jgi:hypothetical protein
MLDRESTRMIGGEGGGGQTAMFVKWRRYVEVKMDKYKIT